MSLKTNIQKFIDQQLPVRTAQLGLVAMAAAATLSSLPDQPDKRVVIPNRPAIKVHDDNHGANPLRREREETAPHHISYSEIQRTPGRTGKY